MVMSAKNKIYIGLVACGIAALVTDRLTRSADPSEALASSLTSNELLVPAAERSHTVIAPTAGSNSLAQLLRSTARKEGWQITGANAARDPFANVYDPASVNDGSTNFSRSHQLTAVITAGGQTHAMVDGKIIRVGEAIDGFVLTNLTLRKATFRKGAGPLAELKLQGSNTFLEFGHS